MALSPEQLKAMISMAPDPNASAGALGHSTNILTKNLSDPFNPFPTTGGVTPMSPSGALSTVGAVGGGILGAIGGGLAGAPTIVGAPVGAYMGGVAGSGLGGAAGEALGEAIETKMGSRQGVDMGQVAKTGGINATLDAVGGPLLSGAGKVIGKVASPLISSVGKGIAKLGDVFGGSGGLQAVKNTGEAIGQIPEKVGLTDPTAQATQRLSSTNANMTKAEREQAILQGRMTEGGKYMPSETEQNAGEIMSGNTSRNPVKTLKAVQDEISNRGQTAEDYLTGNAVKISNKEDADAFAAARNSSEKYMTPSESSAYDEQIGVFQKVLKSYVKGGGYDTSTYYKALKDYEGQVTANLPKGKEALLAPGGAARIQAAKDVRTVVRDMIGDKNPEFKEQMYDLASLYDARDNVVANAEKGGASFAKQHPVLNKTLTYGGEAVGAGVLYEGAKKLGVPLP